MKISSASIPGRGRLGCALMAIALACASWAASAQDVPKAGANAPLLKIVVPAPPGGNSDMWARIVSQGMQSKFGRTVVVENKPGGGGVVGAKTLLNAPADGDTILVMTASTLVIPAKLVKPAPFTLNQFAPVSVFARSNIVLLVNPTLPVNTAAELVSYVKANPKKVFSANADVASIGGFLVKKFADWGGIEIPLISYKGSAAAMQAIMANEVQIFLGDMTQALPFIQSGKLRAIAQLGTERAPQLPNVQTMTETIPGFVGDLWFGFVTRAGAPPAAVETLNRQLNEILGEEATKEKAAAMGSVIAKSTPAQFQALLDEDAKTYGTLIEKMGIKLE